MDTITEKTLNNGVNVTAELITENITPNLDTQYNFGTALKVWANAHIQNITIYGWIYPNSASARQIGSSIVPFKEVWSDTVFADTITELNAGARITMSDIVVASDKIAFTQTDLNEYIDSLADGYLDLEATTGIRLRINATEQVNLIDGVLQPTINNDIDLGTDALEFKDIWIDGVAYLDTVQTDTIQEDTLNTGVTIDSVLLKDGEIDLYTPLTSNKEIRWQDCAISRVDTKTMGMHAPGAPNTLRYFRVQGVTVREAITHYAGAGVNVMLQTQAALNYPWQFRAHDGTSYQVCAQLGSSSDATFQIQRAGDITMLDGKVIMFD